ncbi:MAG: hypothetical protein QM767_00650 [Anaeromyxobacter sp.]
MTLPSPLASHIRPAAAFAPAPVACPRLEAYLAALPAGLASHPSCVVRAGVVEAVLATAPPNLPVPAGMPGELLAVPDRPWIPEVVLQGALLVIADAAQMSDDAVRSWSRETHRQLYRGLAYRALMAFFSPHALLERAETRWNSFHQGSTLRVRREGAEAGVGELSFPAGLYTPLHLMVIAEAFAAALEHSRAVGTTVTLGQVTATSAEFVARWGGGR